MFDIKKVGEQIALLRKEKGLTQDKLAESLSGFGDASQQVSSIRRIPLHLAYRNES